MREDAIVIGGSFAGLSAALQLVRARRRVLLVDAGLPRNRFAAASHGVLGHDGRAPADILGDALDQLVRYPTFRLRRGEAVSAAADGDGFAVALADGSRHRAARLVLATGVRDVLPEIEGMAERWGRSVLHCPYCHGYEVGGRPLGVLAGHPLSPHKALLIPDWGPTTYFTQGLAEPDAEQATALARRGVVVERSPVVALLGEGAALDGVRLADGRVLPMGAVFATPRTELVGTLAAQLGCALDDGPTGPSLRVDERQQTTVPGVFAAGDAASSMPSAPLAMAAGSLAGVGAHQSLVFAAPA
ncbi:NAD(P)/FAD-dependent oxidoreductase [Coralloluteibacterium thermophilus]|uniref:NAD(P)/FAD-dependent oxidoreductase n=1 Tax=Coralloluteibacterium thermophilum TaxID=2707049 RepID=A0ABV9NGB4_9GAMM